MVQETASAEIRNRFKNEIAIEFLRTHLLREKIVKYMGRHQESSEKFSAAAARYERTQDYADSLITMYHDADSASINSIKSVKTYDFQTDKKRMRSVIKLLASNLKVLDENMLGEIHKFTGGLHDYNRQSEQTKRVIEKKMYPLLINMGIAFLTDEYKENEQEKMHEQRKLSKQKPVKGFSGILDEILGDKSR